MRTIAVTEVTNGFLPLLDAAQFEPIVIRQEDHDVAVVLSVAEYDRLRSVSHLDSIDAHERWQVEVEAADQIRDEAFAAMLSDD